MDIYMIKYRIKYCHFNAKSNSNKDKYRLVCLFLTVLETSFKRNSSKKTQFLVVFWYPNWSTSFSFFTGNCLLNTS